MTIAELIALVEAVAAGAYPVKGSPQNMTNEQAGFWNAGVEDTKVIVSTILRKALADVAQSAEASGLNPDQVSVRPGPSVPNAESGKP